MLIKEEVKGNPKIPRKTKMRGIKSRCFKRLLSL
jgi:hypothetical protein